MNERIRKTGMSVGIKENEWTLLLFSSQFSTIPTVAIVVFVLPKGDTAETIQFIGLPPPVGFIDKNQSNPTFDFVTIATLVKEIFLFIRFCSHDISQFFIIILHLILKESLRQNKRKNGSAIIIYSLTDIQDVSSVFIHGIHAKPFH